MALVPFVDKLTILSHLNELSTPILDELAWHLHVDFYDEAIAREQKIKLILSSIAWHRRKGTVGLVKEAIGELYSECEVVENWDYDGGKPYHFKLQLSGYMMAPNIRERVLRILEFVKNKRSWLDGIEYVRDINSDGVYVGGIATAAGSAVAEPSLKISTGPQTQQLYIGGVVTIRQFIHI